MSRHRLCYPSFACSALVLPFKGLIVCTGFKATVSRSFGFFFFCFNVALTCVMVVQRRCKVRRESSKVILLRCQNDKRKVAYKMNQTRWTPCASIINVLQPDVPNSAASFVWKMQNKTWIFWLAVKNVQQPVASTPQTECLLKGSVHRQTFWPVLHHLQVVKGCFWTWVWFHCSYLDSYWSHKVQVLGNKEVPGCRLRKQMATITVEFDEWD